MNPFKNERVVDNIIAPAAETIKSYFPTVLLILTLLCLAYAGFLGAKYYFVRNDEEKLAEHMILVKKGAITIAVMYLVFVILWIAVLIAASRFGASA